MDPLSSDTVHLFKRNRLIGHYTYVRPGELVPHFFSRGAYFLRRTGEREITATVNSCLHRGYKLVTERQRAKQGEPLKCKLHGWKYSPDGVIVETPGFDSQPKANCLAQLQITSVNGIYFESDSVTYFTDLLKFFAAVDVNLDEYVFDQENVSFYQVTWKTIMELYLNGYQLEQQHGGLGNYLKSGSSEWIFTRESSLQVVELCDPSATIPSIGWSKFHEQVRKVGWDKPWGAIFGAIYPGMMVEFYPHTIVINQLVPLSNKMTASYVQIFYDKVAQQDFDFQNAFTEAYSETAQETAFIQDILEDGRMANHYHIADLPAHSRLEAGIKALESWEARNT